MKPGHRQDPPIVAALVQPLLELRAALGTGTTVPDQTLVSALQAAVERVADTDPEHARGLHALESSWDTGADAVPVLRRTRHEIGTVADHGPRYLTLLADAHATNAAAARGVDRIITEFRRDAREVVDTATTAPDADRVIDLASRALRDAITTVNAAQSEMDDHTRRLRGLDPGPLSTPRSWSTSPGTIHIPPSPTPAQTPGAGPGQPVDPAVAQAAIQAQIQQAALAAGVQLGTSVIDAGVEFGLHVVDKVAEVGNKLVDTVAASAQTAIQEGLNPGAHPPAPNTGTPTAPVGPGTPTAPGTSRIDFGPTTPGLAGAVSPVPNTAPAKPDPLASSPQQPVKPIPDPGPASSTAGPLVTPPAAPPTPPTAPDHKPRPGQLGVTMPTAVSSLLLDEPAGVVGPAAT